MLSVIRQTRAALSFLIICAVLFTFAPAQKMSSAKSNLSEKQKILHVLNRLGFGARPADIEKVRRIGLEKYIEQQLNAYSIDDSATEARLKNFPALQMSNDELFARFPNQGAIQRAVARENGISRAELRKSADEKNDGEINSTSDAGQKSETERKNDNASAEERRLYQSRVAEVIRENGFQPPARITQQLAASRIIRAAYSERQLQEVMVDFWTNHFNVYANKSAVRWYLPEYDRDVIRPNALGNFRDLLTATAKSPAMLFYLDNFQSVTPNQAKNMQPNQQIQRRKFNRRQATRLAEMTTDQQMKQPAPMPKKPKKGGGINENYAREIMELHTLGVEGGYSQDDIKEVARAFTGWTILDPRGYARIDLNGKDDAATRQTRRFKRLNGAAADAQAGTFFFNERLHDKNEKTVLGQKINFGDIRDGEKVIEILVNHPSTAKFIARKLAVKFVSDNPSESLVNRIADAFHNSKGDIKTTLRAIFTSKEFFAPENYRAKIKTPFELAVSAIRAVDADTNGGQIQAMIAKMGEPLYGYQAPTGYPDTAEDWVNTGALLERMNFAVALASNRVRGTRTDLTQLAPNAVQENSAAMLDSYLQAILHGEAAAATRNSLLKQLEKPLVEPKLAADDDKEMMPMPNGKLPKGQRGQKNQLLAPSGNAEIFKVVGLILGSPDFQRQ